MVQSKRWDRQGIERGCRISKYRILYEKKIIQKKLIFIIHHAFIVMFLWHDAAFVLHHR